MNIVSELLFVSACLVVSEASKLLLLPSDHINNVNLFAVAASALKQHGHEVVLLANPRHKKYFDKKDASFWYINMNSTHATETEQFTSFVGNQMTFGLSIKEMMALSGQMMSCLSDACHGILGDEPMMTKLKEAQFDMAIVDGVFAAHCLLLVPHKLKLRHLSLSAVHDPWTARVPTLPSVEPTQAMAMSNEMSLMGRIKNTLSFFMLSVLAPKLDFAGASMVTQYCPDEDGLTLDALYRQSELWLVNMDPYVLDYPRVSMPHYHFVGGLGAAPAKSLPPDMEKFAQSAEVGIVVVSFGSLVKKLPKELFMKFMAAFKQVKSLNYFMRFDGEIPEGIPKNVYLSKWLPQNDLLGHSKTKAFITHCGNSGQLESLINGIPQIGFPIFTEQFYNALRAQTKGYGVQLSMNEFTVEQLVQSISEVALTNKYREKIVKAAEIFKSIGDPRENLVFWVDHVLKYGSDHLRPSFINMPFYQFVMMDVLIVMIIVVVTSLCLCKCCIRCTCNKLCGRKSKAKSD